MIRRGGAVSVNLLPCCHAPLDSATVHGDRVVAEGIGGVTDYSHGKPPPRRGGERWCDFTIRSRKLYTLFWKRNELRVSGEIIGKRSYNSNRTRLCLSGTHFFYTGSSFPEKSQFAPAFCHIHLSLSCDSRWAFSLFKISRFRTSRSSFFVWKAKCPSREHPPPQKRGSCSFYRG